MSGFCSSASPLPVVGCAALTFRRRRRRSCCAPGGWRRWRRRGRRRRPGAHVATGREERITLARTSPTPPRASASSSRRRPPGANVYGLTPGSIMSARRAARRRHPGLDQRLRADRRRLRGRDAQSHRRRRPRAGALPPPPPSPPTPPPTRLAAAPPPPPPPRRRRAGADGEVLGGAGRAGGGVVDGDHGEFGAHLVAGGADGIQTVVDEPTVLGNPSQRRRRRGRGRHGRSGGGGGDECGDGGGDLSSWRRWRRACREVAALRHPLDLECRAGRRRRRRTTTTTTARSRCRHSTSADLGADGGPGVHRRRPHVRAARDLPRLCNDTSPLTGAPLPNGAHANIGRQ